MPVKRALALVEEAVQRLLPVYQTEAPIDVHDVLPTPWIGVPKFDDLMLDQLSQCLGLEQQMLAGFVLAVVVPQDQVDDFIRMIQCVLPAAQRGGAEGGNQRRVVGRQVLVGEQQVAIKIDAVGLWLEAGEGNAQLVQQIGLIRHVAIESVDPPGQEIFEVAGSGG